MTTMVQELAEHPELVYRHTVEEYHEMIASGSIMEGEPFELLNGQIVRKIRSATGEDLTTVGLEHALIVKRLSKLTAAFEVLGCHVQSQQPVTIPPGDEPEPDAAIIRGSFEEYTGHHPGPADILCIIEVADSSLSRDRGYKLQLYANAGIAMYVIVNLIDRKVKIYQEPIIGAGRFERVERSMSGESFKLPTSSGEPIVVPVDQMFL